MLGLFLSQLQQNGTPTNSNLPGAGLSDRAFITLYPDDELLKNPRGKQFVAIRPVRWPLWQTVVVGAGMPVIGPLALDQTVTGINQTVTLSCFAQINADPEMRSGRAMTDNVLSILSFMTSVFGSVQFWTPCTDSALSNCYLREPGRVSDGGFGFSTKKTGDAWWYHGTADYEMRFTADFTPQ
jgi:hypothetical protein